MGAYSPFTKRDRRVIYIHPAIWADMKSTARDFGTTVSELVAICYCSKVTSPELSEDQKVSARTWSQWREKCMVSWKQKGLIR